MSFHTFSRNKQPLESDDTLYFKWLRNNPNGFVLAFTLPDEFYVTLHNAHCTYVSRPRSTGAYTRRNYGKHCAGTWEDVEQFMADPRACVEVCGRCPDIRYRENRSQKKEPLNKSAGSLTYGPTPIKRQKPAYASPKTIAAAPLSSEEIKKVADYCRNLLRLEDASLMQGDPYQCVPVCVIDAVFSIGVRYESTEAFVHRFCDHFNIPYDGPDLRPNIADQLSIKEFLTIYKRYGIDRMTSEVYRNRQLTSTRSGILKSEAVLRFSQILFRHGVNYLQDVDAIIGNESFEADIMTIPGQRSEISLRYFNMLTGDDNFIKPDRMIHRFLSAALGRDLTLEECHEIVVGAHSLLVHDYPSLTPKSLDHLIWRYERN